MTPAPGAPDATASGDTLSPPLLRRLITFNCHPFAELDDSWLDPPDRDAALRDAYRSAPRARPSLDAYLSARLALPPPLWRIAVPAERLALLPAASLRRLVVCAGACLCRDAVRHSVAGDDVRRLRRRLGATLYRFVLDRGARLAVPSAFADTPPLAGIDDDGPPLVAAGMRCLGAALAGRPDGLTRRLLLKLPRPWADRFTATDDAALTEQSRHLLLRLAAELGLDDDDQAA